MIQNFSNEYRWLSNFYPCKVTMYGEVYPSVEHAYQAAKAAPADRAKFRAQGVTASEAKKLGRHCKLPERWDDKKLDVMHRLLERKFAPGSALAAKLIATGDEELVEGNYWGDVYWGVCRGKGENNLGKLLMELRSKLREQTETMSKV